MNGGIRAWLTILLSTTTLLSLSARAHYDAAVGAVPTGTDATRRFESIQAAIDDAPSDGSAPFSIFLPAGVYEEKVLIDKPNVHLLGAERDRTVIRWGDYAGMPAPGAAVGATEKLGTFATATVTIEARDFRAENLTIENSFDFLAQDALPQGHPDRVNGMQAVALKTGLNSDRAAFRNVRLSGYQDTLFVQGGRSYFVDSVIEGNVDFIFGAGQALFENSDIVTRPRGTVRETVGYVTAPSTDLGDEYGLVFLHCRLLKAEGVPANSTPLGRPWHPTTTFADGRYADPNAVGAAVFIHSYMDDHITRTGWASMRGTSRDGSKSTVFTPESARFFEYQSRGPGAQVNANRPQLSENEAAQYSKARILRGWEAPF
ncbi:pectin esterase [Microbulbifer elongatus]|uniref:Pectin esterase n=1 Tax=Microbulbifer elongatus TaxID=86173 RepID=A0ABT1P3H1_9GAMM|nr:pectinesterase family protein [Microbulbifer elongatus]MCQ3829544.1 pectin esterase [Microbulbifer elongatus]